MKQNKIIIAIAGIAILFSAICSGIIITQGIHAGTLHTSKTSTRERIPHAWELEKTKLEEFSDITVALSYCDLSILPDDGYYLEYRMDGTCEEPEYEVSGDKFRFQEGHTQSIYRSGFHLFINPSSFASNQGPYYLNLYVPRDVYFNLLTLSNESGSVKITDIQAKNADITANYGDLNMDSFSGEKLSIHADSGNMEFGKIICDTLEISDSYGSVTADSFEIAGHAAISLDSGNLELSKLESRQLTLSNQYGNCFVDEITVTDSEISMESGSLKLRQATLGNTEIRNSYGDITLDLANGTSDYNYDLKAEYGSIKLDGKNIRSDEDGEVYYQKDNGKKNDIRIICESGNIKIR